jgi:serpin B
MNMRNLLVVKGTVGILAAVIMAGAPLSAFETPRQRSDNNMVQSNTQFAVQLYTKLNEVQSGNLFFSPYSISTALAMTCAGAAGDTREEMAEVLQVNVPEPEMHAAMAKLIAALRSSDKGYQLRVANRLWGQTGYAFLPEFLQTTRSIYEAQLGEVDFAKQTEQARRTINQWIEQQTEAKIKDLIPAGLLASDTRLVLTNAIYFKGSWQESFDKESTQDAPYFASGDKEITIPTMHQVARFGYRASEGLQVLELPYAGRALSMVILLPASKNGLNELEQSISRTGLVDLVSGLRWRDVSVFLPRFKLSCQFSLRDALASMGMPLAFDPDKADFSRMSRDERLVISAVVHKAFVDVNEEGTEAAAATGVIMAPTAAPVQEEPPTFRADHPFVFLIRDNRTGSILFLGRVINPQE